MFQDLWVPPYVRLLFAKGLDFLLGLPLPFGLANVGNSTLKSFALVRRYRMMRTLARGLYAASNRAIWVASKVFMSSRSYVPASMRSAVSEVFIVVMVSFSASVICLEINCLSRATCAFVKSVPWHCVMRLTGNYVTQLYTLVKGSRVCNRMCVHKMCTEFSLSLT